MWVSEWRVPLMKVTPEMIGQSPARLIASSAPRPFSTVMIVASGQAPAQRRRRRLEAAGLRRDDAEVERRKRVRIGRGAHRRLAIAAPADAEAVALERRGVLGPARQDRDVGDRGQMACEEAADGARPDDAHALHAATGSPRPAKI